VANFLLDRFGCKNQYAESDIKPRHSLAEFLSLLQVLALLGGLACLAYFAVKNVG
jgi:hypothetical protein